MYIEAMVPMPEDGDTSAFVKALENARQVGATALRSACLHTRRYETFATPAAWQAHVEESHRSVAAAVPLLENTKSRLVSRITRIGQRTRW
jgi:3-oxoisoapionate decarboxylase